MATLDVLDSERRAHAGEVSDARYQCSVLQAQVRAARAERTAMEVERDSLREAVMHLIEKVELCNDYGLWPHSGLASTSLAAPPRGRSLHEPPEATWIKSARAYSAAVITALREEYERERAARAEVVQRVTELEAQLARREAELEARYDTASTPLPRAESPPLRLSREDAIRALQQSAARNEALTHEVAGLVQKLENAHAALEESPPMGTENATRPGVSRTATPPPLSPTSLLSPRPATSSPSLLPQRPLKSPSPLLLSPPSPLLEARTQTQLTSRASVVPAAPVDLARQIEAVMKNLEGLRAEEQRLSHASARARAPLHQDTPSRASTPHAFKRILLVEEECIRLRAELAASAARETALRELIVPLPAPVPTQEDVLGHDDGEPMELATPLQPTVLLDPDDLWPG
ncbi:hypothetical protein BC834DRAFT_974334 [Gloeopeniophorella convolvens]|nr:hypothetical protein BC834DRAFT_974334 [Gloeopeniophorella convolvens]